MTDQDRSSSIGTILGRTGEGFLDSLADNGLRVGKVLGGTLQATFNTKGYQRDQALRDLALRSAEANTLNNELRNAELVKDIPVNDARRGVILQQNQEYMDNIPLREQQRQLDSSQMYMNQVKAYQGIYDAEAEIASKNRIKRLKAENPFARDISDEGLERFKSSDEFKGAEIFDTLGRLYLKSKQSDDPVLKAAFENGLRNNGMELIEQDGKEYLYEANTDMIVELNEENFNKASAMLSENMNKELRVRFALEGSRDNLDKNAMNKLLTPEILGFYSNSMVKASTDYMDFMKSLPEVEYHNYLLLRGIQDAFLDGVITTDEQQALLPQLLNTANKVGYRVHVDNENPMNTQIEKADGSRVTLQQFAKDLEAANTVDEKYARYVMAKFAGKKGGVSFSDGEEEANSEHRVEAIKQGLWDANLNLMLDLTDSQQDKLAGMIMKFYSIASDAGWINEDNEVTNDLRLLNEAKTYWEKQLKGIGIKSSKMAFPFQEEINNIEGKGSDKGFKEQLPFYEGLDEHIENAKRWNKVREAKRKNIKDTTEERYQEYRKNLYETDPDFRREQDLSNYRDWESEQRKRIIGY